LDTRQTLGVQITPDGNNEEEATYLTGVAKEWVKKIAQSQLQPVAAEYCIHNIVYCKLMYPLVATTFTHTQCAEIIKLLLAAGFLAVWYMRVFPYAVIHGPFSRQGVQSMLGIEKKCSQFNFSCSGHYIAHDLAEDGDGWLAGS